VAEAARAEFHRRVMLAEVATAYYVQDLTKVDIAKSFGISRFQVARLLEEARATGLVTIEVHDPRLPRSAREQALAAELGVDTARIVEQGDSTADAEGFGATVLASLVEAIRPGMTVGVSWSRTLDRAARYVPDLPPCHLVQLTGAFELPGSSAFRQMLQQLDRRGGIDTFPLYAPLVVDHRSTAQDLRRQPVIAQTLSRADAMDLAVVAVGAWRAGESAVWDKVYPDVRAACTKAGAVAEFSGILLDAAGAVVETPLDGRVIAITLPQLRQAGHVIGFAHGSGRAAALRAATASGAFSSVIVDGPLADAVLAKPTRRHA
jgi:DNA-binding transcriptional regulator LsrR (DeoR family)